MRRTATTMKPIPRKRGARRTGVVLPAGRSILVLAVGLLLTFALPAAAAPKDLRVSNTSCGSVAVVAEGMPASSQLLLLARDLSNGKVLNTSGKPMSVGRLGAVAPTLFAHNEHQTDTPLAVGAEAFGRHRVPLAG